MDASPLSPPATARLPSGRHRLTRDAIVGSQRGRMLEAMVDVVADKGYPAATVADVVARAGVSRRTFYEQFRDKEACYLAAYEAGVDYVLGRIREDAASVPVHDWRGALRSNIETYLRVLADEPAFAWSLHVEALSASPAALAQRARIFARFTDRTRRAYERARSEDASKPPLPDEAFAFHSGGIDELIRECLRARGAEALPTLIEPAVATTMALFGEREDGDG
ncbi:MAG: TetR/AcrR family transcriptional regulator [Solirubrobacterales bacterium]